MARVTVEDCLHRVSNRFALVALVSKRVKQYIRGSQCLVKQKNSDVVNALREVEKNHIRFDCGELSPEEQLQNDLNAQIISSSSAPLPGVAPTTEGGEEDGATESKKTL